MTLINGGIMKALTYGQRKWMLASALIAVLAANVSFGPQPKIVSVDFASTVARDPDFAKEESENDPDHVDYVDESEETDSDDSEQRDVVKELGKKTKAKKTTAKQKEKKKKTAKKVAKVKKRKGTNYYAAQKSSFDMDGEEIPVDYIDVDQKNVLAFVQGGFCETGCVKVLSLAGNTDDIEDLNKQVRKYIEQQGEEIEEVSTKIAKKKHKKKEIVEEEEEQEVEEQVAEETDEDNIILANIKENCEEAVSNKNELVCFKKEFLKALTKNKDSDGLDEETALNFYKTEIQQRLISQVSEALKLSAENGQANESTGSLINHMNSRGLSTRYDKMIKDASDIIAELVRKTPKKYDSIRESVLAAQQDILKFEAIEYKKARTNFLNEKDPKKIEKNLNEQNRLANDFNLMQQEFYERNFRSLDQALVTNSISTNTFADYNEAMVRSNRTLLEFLNGNGTLSSDMNTNTPVDLSNRLNNPGRGTRSSGQATQHLNAVSSRTGGSSSRNQLQQSSGLQQIDLSSDGSSTIQATPSGTLIIPQENRGVEFGTVEILQNKYNELRSTIREKYQAFTRN